jgi:hypothetical protein
VHPLSWANLSIGSVLGCLCWKWKPYPRVVFQVQIGLSIILYMRSLFLVGSCDLRLSSQYILVSEIPSCFHFAKMCLCQVSLLSRYSLRFLTFFSWESCTLFIWTWAFILNFLSQYWIAARLVCSFCEAMAGTLSVASTAVVGKGCCGVFWWGW